MAAFAIAVLVAITGIKIYLHPEAIAAMQDPDSWLRLVIISDLYHGTGWYDHWVERMNPPQGMLSPWTRPVDLLVLLLAAPFLAFLPFDAALMAGRFLYNPLLLLCGTSLLYATAHRIAPLPYVMWLLLPMLLLTPSVGDYFAIGGVDHHSLLAVLAIALWYLFTRFSEAPERSGFLRLAGACAGLGIWVSVEFQLAAGGFLCGLLWMWCWHGEARWLRGFLHATCMLLGVLCLALIAEKPAAARWLAEYDTVSVAHLLSFTYLLMAYALLWCARGCCTSPIRRFAGANIAGGAALAAMLAAFPQMIHGPMAGVSPALQTAFLDQVAEMQPLWKLGAEYVLAFGCHVLIALALLVKYWREIPKTPSFWLLLLLTLCFFLLTLSARRMAYYFIPLSALLLLWVLAQSRQTMRPVFMLALGMLPALFLLLTGAIQKQLGMTAHDPLRYEQCLSSLTPLVESGELLRLLGDTPLLVGVHGNLGPYLLFRTPYRIISSNYHRDASGLFDLNTLLKWQDEDGGKEILKKRGVAALILCDKPRNDLRLPRYLRKESPAWAEEIYTRTGKQGAHLRIYRISGEYL